MRRPAPCAKSKPAMENIVEDAFGGGRQSGEPSHDDADARFGMSFELPSSPGRGMNQFFSGVAQAHAVLLRLSGRRCGVPRLRMARLKQTPIRGREFVETRVEECAGNHRAGRDPIQQRSRKLARGNPTVAPAVCAPPPASSQGTLPDRGARETPPRRTGASQACTKLHACAAADTVAGRSSNTSASHPIAAMACSHKASSCTALSNTGVSNGSRYAHSCHTRSSHAPRGRMSGDSQTRRPCRRRSPS